MFCWCCVGIFPARYIYILVGATAFCGTALEPTSEFQCRISSVQAGSYIMRQPLNLLCFHFIFLLDAV